MFEFDPGNITNIAQIVIAIISVVLGFKAFTLSLRARSELSLGEQIGNIHTLFIEPYQERRFRKPLEIDGKKVLSIKEARSQVHELIKPQKNESAKKARDRFLDRTMDPTSWENVFAYEISLGLDTVGAAILAGALPLSFVLASNAVQIVEDWTYCSRLVKERIREQPEAPMPRNKKMQGIIKLHRLHGEWLAYASAIWLSSKWSGTQIESLFEELGDLKSIKVRERQLRHFSSELISKATNQAIQKILGVRN